jgi:hypothetical protein
MVRQVVQVWNLQLMLLRQTGVFLFHLIGIGTEHFQIRVGIVCLTIYQFLHFCLKLHSGLAESSYSGL